jgi:hypothetical protein
MPSANKEPNQIPNPGARSTAIVSSLENYSSHPHCAHFCRGSSSVLLHVLHGTDGLQRYAVGRSDAVQVIDTLLDANEDCVFLSSIKSINVHWWSIDGK